MQMQGDTPLFKYRGGHASMQIQEDTPLCK